MGIKRKKSRIQELEAQSQKAQKIVNDFEKLGITNQEAIDYHINKKPEINGKIVDGRYLLGYLQHIDIQKVEELSQDDFEKIIRPIKEYTSIEKIVSRAISSTQKSIYKTNINFEISTGSLTVAATPLEAQFNVQKFPHYFTEPNKIFNGYKSSYNIDNQIQFVKTNLLRFNIEVYHDFNDYLKGIQSREDISNRYFDLLSLRSIIYLNLYGCKDQTTWREKYRMISKFIFGESKPETSVDQIIRGATKLWKELSRSDVKQGKISKDEAKLIFEKTILNLADIIKQRNIFYSN